MTVRCAIYTRKSTDEGLEQAFNSLDNQRLAGESYVMSQAHEGWEIIEKHYDVGGYSGGNMDRPAFQELLQDIEADLVNCVVVYKIDRLTRSLLDFAQIVEIFDKHNVSFVAVTQSFNTSNSMGRLMLNVLLSFAQYERELSAERVRDKIAASKKLGYWMGGYAPLGYDVKDRGLVINPKEAENVKLIYDKFLELKSLTKVLEFTKSAGIQTKSERNFCKKTLRDILNNPIYKGYISHKGVEYKGRHKGVISEKVFAKVQAVWKKIPEERKEKTASNSLLKDLIRCKSCDCVMTPTYCCKNKRKYRYYACSNHLRSKGCKAEHKTLPAGEVEQYVSNFVRESLKTPEICSLTIENLRESGIDIEVARKYAQNVDKAWSTLSFEEQSKIVKNIVQKVEVDDDQVDVFLNQSGMQNFVKELTE